MPEFPVSLVISLLLTLLVVRSIVDKRSRLDPLATVALALYALQCVIVGLRWGYDISLGWPVQAALAALIPGVTWVTLRRIVGSRAARQGRVELALHAVPSALVLASPVLPLPDLDYIIIGLFLGYGIALLRSALSRDPTFVDRIPFQGALPTNAAFAAAGGVLIASGLVDMAVSWDLNSNAGALAGDIVGYAQLVLLAVLSAAVVTVGALREPETEPADAASSALAQAADEADDEAGQPTDAELDRQHAQIVLALDAAMTERHLYRDPNLSLERLARKMLIPARQISAAINAHRAMNVSQYVNTFRILEACDRLRNSDQPVTTIIFDVGFQTKSNFNREFRRFVGMSPTEWRQGIGLEERSASLRAGWPEGWLASGLGSQDAPANR